MASVVLVSVAKVVWLPYKMHNVVPGFPQPPPTII